MSSYTVMEPPQGQAGEARIIRDGFTLLAFLFAPFWLAWHRLWVEALVVFAIQLLLGALGEAYGLRLPASLLSLLLSFYVGLEAPAMRAAGLRRRGFVDWGVVDAASHAEAEIRYAAAVEAAGAGRTPTTPAALAAPTANRSPEGPALGLLGYSGH